MIFFKEKLPPQITESDEIEIISHLDKENKKRLIEGNMRIALFVAKRFEGKMDSDELISISMEGIVKAAHKFNPSKGVKFNTFAVHVIQNEILKELRSQKKTYGDVSLQTPVEIRENQDRELGDMLCDEKADRDLQKIDNLCTIELAAECLSDRERHVVINWINGVKQAQTASEMGVSQAQICRILNNAFKKMKERSKLNGY